MFAIAAIFGFVIVSIGYLVLLGPGFKVDGGTEVKTMKLPRSRGGPGKLGVPGSIGLD